MIVIDNLLTSDEVKQFRSALASVPFNDGKETAMGMAAGVKITVRPTHNMSVRSI